MKNLFRRFITSNHGKVVVYQRPNLPLIVWAGVTLLALFIPGHPIHGLLAGVAFAALVIWSVLEIGWGASPFRRTLGGLVFLWTLLSRFW